MARKGVHHVRAESRSQLMAMGSTRSAKATHEGVMKGSAYTMKGTWLKYL